nr:50S ribosomal protein 6, chloroplastic [Tanacetum cinerariifolium]
MACVSSAILGVKLSIPKPSDGPRQASSPPQQVSYYNGTGGGGGLMIECSSRPQKKATAHHRKTRPKKTQPWDRNRGPAVYPPLPALPPEWSFATETEAVQEEPSEASTSQ